MRPDRTHLLILALIFLLLAIGLTGVLISVNAEKAPTDQHVILEWGETIHILCTQDAFDSQPNGIMNIDVTGSDNFAIACREPGTTR